MQNMNFDELGSLRSPEGNDSEVYFWSNSYVVSNINGVPLAITKVRRGEEMRLDKVSQRLYSTVDHVEDLMLLNTIYNQFSIREGDFLFYTSPNAFRTIRQSDRAQQQVRSEIRRRTSSGTPGTSVSTSRGGRGTRLNNGNITLG